MLTEHMLRRRCDQLMSDRSSIVVDLGRWCVVTQGSVLLDIGMTRCPEWSGRQSHRSLRHIVSALVTVSLMQTEPGKTRGKRAIVGWHRESLVWASKVLLVVLLDPVSPGLDLTRCADQLTSAARLVDRFRSSRGLFVVENGAL